MAGQAGFFDVDRRLEAISAKGDPLVTIESQTPVRDFDVFAFSVSFEWDYTNVVTMLRLAGLRPRAADRTAHDPLVVIGGAVTFVNPEPLALFADVVAAGEGEVLVPSFLDAYQQARETLVEELGLDPSPELRELEQRMSRGAHDDATMRRYSEAQARRGQPLYADNCAACHGDSTRVLPPGTPELAKAAPPVDRNGGTSFPNVR